MAPLVCSFLVACGARSELDVSEPGLSDSGVRDSSSADVVSFDAADSSDASPASTCPFSVATFLVDLPTDIVRQVAVDDARVYYVRLDGSIWTVSKTGGAPSPFATADTTGSVYAISTFAMDQDFLYYESSALNTFVRRPKQGGLETVIGPTVPQASVVKGPDALYVWSFEGGQVGNYSLVRVPFGGGPSTVITDALPQDLTDIVIDGGVAYLATRFALVELNLAGGQMISHPNVSAAYLAVDTARVYASGYPSSPTTPIFSFLKSNGTAQIITSFDGNPAKLVLDGPWLYFGDTLGGFIHRVPVTGGLASDEVGFAYDLPLGIAIDGDCIYWGGEEGVFVAPR